MLQWTPACAGVTQWQPDQVVILLAVWAIAPVELPSTAAIAKRLMLLSNVLKKSQPRCVGLPLSAQAVSTLRVGRLFEFCPNQFEPFLKL